MIFKCVHITHIYLVTGPSQRAAPEWLQCDGAGAAVAGDVAGPVMTKACLLSLIAYLPSHKEDKQKRYRQQNKQDGQHFDSSRMVKMTTMSFVYHYSLIGVKCIPLTN